MWVVKDCRQGVKCPGGVDDNGESQRWMELLTTRERLAFSWTNTGSRGRLACCVGFNAIVFVGK